MSVPPLAESDVEGISCWITRLQERDAVDLQLASVGSAAEVLFDARPSEIRRGHLLFCVDPRDGRIVVAARVTEHGDAALHDKSDPTRVKWLFRVPVETVAGPKAPGTGQRVSEVGGLAGSYRRLRSSQALSATAAFTAQGNEATHGS